VVKKHLTFLKKETVNLQDAGLAREELTVSSPQDPEVAIGDRKVVNLASSNYLGLANSAAIKRGAKKAIDELGAGIASTRMLAGTVPLHATLEDAIATFVGTETALLFGSGYHANTGLFESLFDYRDFIVSDVLSHPTLADGIRLSSARVMQYRNNDLDHLEDRLKRTRAARFRAIVTDGVFPLDGAPAELDRICDLAEAYDALVIVDDAQGIGVLGKEGRGTHELYGVINRVDVLTGSFSNALGGCAGGWAAGRREIITWLRQKSRPYLTSSAPSPANAGAALAALEHVQKTPSLLEKLHKNVELFRAGLVDIGFEVLGGEHPILAVMVGNVVAAQRMADILMRHGVYVVGFCHPVVPEGQARIRAQISAQHTERGLRRALAAFGAAGRELRLLR
jgi:glycine C-acetyltransferase